MITISSMLSKTEFLECIDLKTKHPKQTNDYTRRYLFKTVDEIIQGDIYDIYLKLNFSGRRK